MNINWEDSSSYIQAPNSANLSREERGLMLEQPGIIWFKTSGSTCQKWIGLSKAGLLESARAVNSHYQVQAKDRWCLCLPTSHVGGFSILARAQVVPFAVDSFDGAWNPERFSQFITITRSSIVSLVPTQLYDLVKANLTPPSDLRLAVLGGASLDRTLAVTARNLGWPILETYGLTEASSHVAAQPLRTTSSNASDLPLEILPHLEVRTDEASQLMLKGNAVAKLQLVCTPSTHPKLVDPRVDEWLLTSDMARLESEIDRRTLTFLGRADRQIKILGELLSLDALEREIQSHINSEAHTPCCLFALPDERRGHRLTLIIEGKSNGVSLQQLNRSLPGLKQLSELHFIAELPRLTNGKLDLITISNLRLALKG